MTLDEIKVRQVTRRLEGKPRFEVQRRNLRCVVWDHDLERPNTDKYYTDYASAARTADILNSLNP